VLTRVGDTYECDNCKTKFMFEDCDDKNKQPSFCSSCGLRTSPALNDEAEIRRELTEAHLRLPSAMKIVAASAPPSVERIGGNWRTVTVGTRGEKIESVYLPSTDK
jgi:hypothetical protein